MWLFHEKLGPKTASSQVILSVVTDSHCSMPVIRKSQTVEQDLDSSKVTFMQKKKDSTFHQNVFGSHMNAMFEDRDYA